jgi:hypothetical protein
MSSRSGAGGELGAFDICAVEGATEPTGPGAATGVVGVVGGAGGAGVVGVVGGAAGKAGPLVGLPPQAHARSIWALQARRRRPKR